MYGPALWVLQQSVAAASASQTSGDSRPLGALQTPPQPTPVSETAPADPLRTTPRGSPADQSAGNDWITIRRRRRGRTSRPFEPSVAEEDEMAMNPPHTARTTGATVATVVAAAAAVANSGSAAVGRSGVGSLVGGSVAASLGGASGPGSDIGSDMDFALPPPALNLNYMATQNEDDIIDFENVFRMIVGVETEYERSTAMDQNSVVDSSMFSDACTEISSVFSANPTENWTCCSSIMAAPVGFWSPLVYLRGENLSDVSLETIVADAAARKARYYMMFLVQAWRRAVQPDAFSSVSVACSAPCCHQSLDELLDCGLGVDDGGTRSALRVAFAAECAHRVGGRRVALRSSRGRATQRATSSSTAQRRARTARSSTSRDPAGGPIPFSLPSRRSMLCSLSSLSGSAMRSRNRMQP
eukprot:TRINITY_DN1686_c0_g1_i3.p1 TRINITY_DN1686_c0_g1~~TRINITY_DN1686_c0_g1_i3.p1  ORF type:complete len:414 (-),score=35.28 TRINITY_DN1686_c0_g1_i3:171-1412(-)